MKKHLSLNFIPLLFIIISFSYECGAEQTVKWFHADFPPAFILHGDEKGTGYCDRMEKDVTSFLTDYKHEFYESNYKRIVKSLREGMNVCCASMYKTPEREKFSAYSEPIFIGMSNGIIISKEKKGTYEKYMTPERELDLHSLLKQEKNVRIGVFSGRNYGRSIENAISAFRKTETIQERSRNDSVALLNMLLRQRIHMILALPMEISYVLRQSDIKKNALRFFHVKGGEKFTTAYMACSGNEWGREVIEKINVIIRQKRSVFAEYYRDWLDKSGAEAYKKIVEKDFGIKLAE